MSAAMDIGERWIRHQRKNYKTTQVWACIYCDDRRIFHNESELWEHAKTEHTEQIPIESRDLEAIREFFLLECGVKKPHNSQRKPNVLDSKFTLDVLNLTTKEESPSNQIKSSEVILNTDDGSHIPHKEAWAPDEWTPEFAFTPKQLAKISGSPQHSFPRLPLPDQNVNPPAMTQHGDNPSTTELDSRFQMVKSHEFKPGAIFKVLWAEPSGKQLSGKELQYTTPTNKRWNPFANRMYKKVAGFRRKALRILFNGHDTFARPDTASDRDIMTEAFANEHNIQIQRDEHNRSLFKLGDGNYVKSVGKAQVPIKLLTSGEKEESRWFHVLRRCPVPLILGMDFIEKIKLYTKNKHLLVDCPHTFGDLPTLKWIGSPRGIVDFRADGKQLIGCADTGSDLDFMSLRCARERGFKIDTNPNACSRVMLADESIVNTVGQVHISSVELSRFDSFEMSFHILPGLASDVIFSEDFLDQMDAFNTCAQVKDSQDPYQQHLNTLISLGPIQSFLSRTWTPNATDTTQKVHDHAIEAEIFRRYKANRAIRKIRDEDRVLTAREAEESIRSNFDRGHERCPHCVVKDVGPIQ